MHYVLCVFLFVMKLIFCLCYSVVVYSMCVYICTCSIYVSSVCRCVFMCAFIYTCICLIVNFHIFYCSARTKAPLASVPITLEGKTMS